MRLQSRMTARASRSLARMSQSARGTELPPRLDVKPR